MSDNPKKPSVKERFKTDQAVGSASELLQELFQDFNRDRKAIYQINFIRGIFFGLGSAIGGTLVLGLIVWILSLFNSTWIGPIVRSIEEASNK